MTRNGSNSTKRSARRLQRDSGIPYSQALAQVQRETVPVGRCPACGSYDLDTEHGGGGQPVTVCNDCPWGEA